VRINTASESTIYGGFVLRGVTATPLTLKLSIIIKRDIQIMAKKLTPNHPRKHLNEFLADYGLSKYRLAKDINVPLTRITTIVDGKRGITADTALRLGRYFCTTAQCWVSLQNNYDVQMTSKAEGKAIENIKPLAA